MAFEIKKKPKKVTDEEAPSKKKKKDKKKGGKEGSFLKTGKSAKKLMDRAEAEYKARKDRASQAWRFWLKPDEDAYITFLDGRIDPDTGILDIPYANEHREKIDGRYEDVLCTEDNEPCPLCAAGSKKSFVGYLSIIDHRPREYEKDGKTVKVKHTRRLFVAKSESLKQLTKMAEKREDGLAGSTYEVSRTGDKKAAIGDLFDYSSTHSAKEIKEEFGDDGEVLDYDENITYRTAEELLDLGLGKGVEGIGSFKSEKKSKKKKDKGGKKKKGMTEDDVDDKDAPW